MVANSDGSLVCAPLASYNAPSLPGVTKWCFCCFSGGGRGGGFNKGKAPRYERTVLLSYFYFVII